MNKEQARKNWEEAIRLGERTYEGRACRKFGHTERLTSSNHCIKCRTKNARKNRDNKKTKEQIKRSEEVNKAKEERKTAKAKNEKFYFGASCIKCGNTKRYVSDNRCFQCTKNYDNKRLKTLTTEQKEARRKADNEYKKRNRKTIREKRKEYHKEYREKNKEHINQYSREWSKSNAHKKREYTATRRARELRATPIWINREEIEAFYEVAHNLTKETDTKYEVDHIIPLCGELVCGLHVPWNLRIIEMKKNRSKANKFEVI